jgi:hypothetical protein
MSYPTFALGDKWEPTDANAVGLWLVKTQAVGSGVSSVTVTGAFSADYDNYIITISGGTTSVNGSVSLQLSNSTASTYNVAGNYGNYGTNVLTYNPAAAVRWNDVMYGGTVAYSGVINLVSPFANRATTGFTEGSSTATFYKFSLIDTSTNSSTGFTFAPVSGTMTGGTIRVYGYRN